MKDSVKGLWRKTKISKTGLHLNKRLELQLLIFIELFSKPVHPSKRVRGEQSLAEIQQAASRAVFWLFLFGFAFYFFCVLGFPFQVVTLR